MSRDRFLTELYKSMLQKQPVKKTGKPFKSLQESYTQIYEQDAPVEQPVAEQPTTEQEHITFDVNKPVLTRQAWTPEQAKLFNYKTSTGETAGEGTGRGEYSVASLLTGKTELNQISDLISGGNKSYDVSWPSKDKPTYKFEVKELDRYGERGKDSKPDVRIGTEGDAIGRETISTITTLLKEILNEYEALDPEDQKQIDRQIISYALENVQAPTPEIGRGNKEKAGSVAKRQKYEAYMAARGNWSLKGYINAIVNKTAELGQSLMFGDNPLPTSNFRDLERQKYCFFSIKKLFEALTDIELILSDDKGVDETNPRVQSLRDVLRRNYGAEGDTEEITTLKAYIDSEAQKLDRKLTKIKCKATGEGCAQGKDFYRDLKHLNLNQHLNNLQQKIFSPDTIRLFFPRDLTGFFAVNPNGYLYTPASKIGELVTFHSISLGRPKVKLKDQKLD
jgi:hypothetical protein